MKKMQIVFTHATAPDKASVKSGEYVKRALELYTKSKQVTLRFIHHGHFRFTKSLLTGDESCREGGMLTALMYDNN